nr:hypothetical protein [Clostridioides sp.]
MSDREMQICYEIADAIDESIFVNGYLNKNELKEYIDSIFEIEKIPSEDLDKMKKLVFERVSKTSEYFFENIKTGEVKKYFYLKEACKELNIPTGGLESYINRNVTCRKTYRMTKLPRYQRFGGIMRYA